MFFYDGVQNNNSDVDYIKCAPVVPNIRLSLYFKLNKQKYLYGLSYTLSLDASALRKTTPDHILLPSQPYLPSLSLFLWQLQVLQPNSGFASHQNQEYSGGRPRCQEENRISYER